MGYPHPDYLFRFLSARQLTEWEIYYSQEPFGQYPEYLRAGIVAATIANAFRGKASKVFSPEDFMPKGLLADSKDARPRKQSIEEQKKVLNSIYAWAKERGLTKEDQKKKPPKRVIRKPKSNRGNNG